MIREIKVRGWNTRTNVMHSAEEMGQDQLTLSVDGRGFINVSGLSTKLSTFPKHIIPMEYIGLNDTNHTEKFPDGKPVCEGDIVKSVWQVDHETKIVGQVKYYSVFALWSLMDSKGDMVSPCWNDCEVIGDIHQNPELLE